MDLIATIDTIKDQLRQGVFTSEAAVSQGILMRILSALDWNVFDTSLVIPEYSVEGRRVDFALCNNPNKVAVFVEVKKVGMSEGADRQLFEYAFHIGVPMAILTDGQEWNFFLPGEQGRYDERRFYKLDLLERSSREAAERLKRYLRYDAICSGKALESAREDYKKSTVVMTLKRTIPRAWEKLIADQDSLLLEMLADQVEVLCGYKPDLEMCSRFLEDIASESRVSRRLSPEKNVPKASSLPSQSEQTKIQIPIQTQPQCRKSRNSKSQELYFMGQLIATSSARDLMSSVFNILIEQDSGFLERFAARKHGRKRRYLDRDRYKLYDSRPDLCEQHAIEIAPGWWLGTNYSKSNIQKIITLAMEVADKDIRSHFSIRFD